MKRHTETGKSRLRTGHTRWKAVFYGPNQVDDARFEAFAAIYICQVTRVQGTTVNYDCQDAGYIAGRRKFLEITEPTFRKAYRKAKQMVADYERECDAATKLSPGDMAKGGE